MTQALGSPTLWPSRRERILKLAEHLSANLDALDLDDVDGEFYWRICRDELLEPLAHLAASFAPNTAEGHPSYDKCFDDLQNDKTQLLGFIQSSQTDPRQDAPACLATPRVSRPGPRSAVLD